MHQLKYIVYKEDKYYVSQCLNVDVASFGNNIDEAIENLKEAVELYLEDETNAPYYNIDSALIGEAVVNA
jgi:predicted RNase H-like HicB family nuclease